MSKLKKSTNVNNIKKATDDMAECSDNISYLKRWPEDKYEPFPILNEEKVERYNMDEN